MINNDKNRYINNIKNHYNIVTTTLLIRKTLQNSDHL